MKVALINGSPRGKESTSRCFVETLEKLLEGVECLKLTWHKSEVASKDFKELMTCEAIVFCFPLYIDSIPSHLLRILRELEVYVKANRENREEVKVYVLVNNGFFDEKQNCLALENIGHWCNKAGVTMGQGIGFGGGGMVAGMLSMPAKRGPMKEVVSAFEELAHHIIAGETGETRMVKPKLPAFVYNMMVEKVFFRGTAKKNGLKTKDLFRRIEKN